MIANLDDTSVNKINITGTITNIDNSYKEFEIIAHGLNIEVKRYDQYSQTFVYDNVRIHICHNPNVKEDLKMGDRIEVTGELQSRNFNKKSNEASKEVLGAVKNYIELFEEFPARNIPTGNNWTIIDFSLLINSGLLGVMPKDSRYDFDGGRLKDTMLWTYKVDNSGNVQKVREGTAYELLVENNYRKIESLKENEVDKNSAVLQGRITKINEFKIPNYLNRYSVSLRVKVACDVFQQTRYWDLYVKVLEKDGKKKTGHLKIGDFIRVTGHLSTRAIKKNYKDKGVTAGGTTKRKEKIDEYLTRDIYAYTVEKL
ncbi:hypothetical protein [Solibacillus sp. FSL H8-0538]|uniref:hypothetical protein n=1 Tax=Solibacillus sp. FSL H8-0538 TaxID=2921400 RepID=UPI0030FAE7A5